MQVNILISKSDLIKIERAVRERMPEMRGIILLSVTVGTAAHVQVIGDNGAVTDMYIRF